MTDPAREELAEAGRVASARAEFYRFLAAAVLAPPDGNSVAALLEPGFGAFLAEALEDARIAAALGALRAAGQPELKPLADEYHTLFVVPGQRYCKPYGSVHCVAAGGDVPQLLAGESSREVLRLYRRAGYQPAADFRDLPDHLGAELSFLAHLCDEEQQAWVSGDEATARALGSTQREFLLQHLAPLAEGVAGAVEQAARAPYFSSVAAVLRAFVRAETHGAAKEAS